LRLNLLIACLVLSASLAAQTNMPAFWHTYEECVAAMDDWAQQYPDIVQMDSIGVTNGAPWQDPITIYALKISDNVQTDEDEPALLFVGQAHAEEVMGIEIVLTFIQNLLSHQTQWPYSQYISDLELWFVPTMNPEGLHVVMDMDDDSYRKNMRDNNENGIFDYVVDLGSDIDGVDLNRNYDFEWVHGRLLYEVGNDTEVYDYYRGPAPFSEGENRAIRDLAVREHFIYSINYHSSRSGRLREKVYTAWEFAGLSSRRCPDYDISMQIAAGVGTSIPKFGAAGNYEYSASQGRVSTSTTWFYAALGTYQLTIEVSDNHPDSTNMVTIVNNNIQGMHWLLKRALNGVLETCPMLRGRVVDANTGEPLVAEVAIDGRESNYLSPRLTDATYGRFWRPVTSGSYTLIVRKKGYATHTQNVVVSPSGWSQNYLIQLEPLGSCRYPGSRTGPNDEPVWGTLVVADNPPDTINVVNGALDFTIYEGNRQMEVWAPGYAHAVDTLHATPGNHGLHVSLAAENVLFSETFNDSTTCQFTATGPWQFISELAHEGQACTDSWKFKGFYAPYCDVNLTTTSPIALPAAGHAYLEWWEHVYTEPVWDPCTVSASTDGENWTTLYTISGKHDTWRGRLLNLDDYLGQSIYLRYRLTDDSPDTCLCDPGWTIDDVRVVAGDYTVTGVAGSQTQPPVYNRLEANYPNPFNPETTFRFSLGPAARQAEIRVYNIRGCLVDVLPLGEQERREGKVRWNAAGFSSGIYLYRLRADGVDYPARKACLLK